MQNFVLLQSPRRGDNLETIWRQRWRRSWRHSEYNIIISTPWTQNGHLPWLFRGITSLIVSPWRFYFIRNFLRGQNQRRCEESGRRFLGITRIFIIIDKIILISHDPPKTLFPDSSWTCCKPKKEWKYCTCTRTAVVESGNKKRPTISVSAQVLQFGINYFAFFGLHLSFSFHMAGTNCTNSLPSTFAVTDREYCSATKTNKKRLLSLQSLSHHVNVSYIF